MALLVIESLNRKVHAVETTQPGDRYRSWKTGPIETEGSVVFPDGTRGSVRVASPKGVTAEANLGEWLRAALRQEVD